MNTDKRKVSILILVTVALLLLLLFSSCEMLLNQNEELRPYCDGWIEAIMADDFDAAKALAPGVKESDLKRCFNQCADSFEGVTSYEVKQVGWNVNMPNGITRRYATYEITTDTGSLCYLEIAMQDGMDGLFDVTFLDSTEFMEKTEYLQVVNIVFILLSLAFMAFVVWMIVDCARRAIKLKFLWILLILSWLTLSLSVGLGHFNFNFGLWITLKFSSISRVALSQSVSLEIVLPIGALVYFFVRKKFKLKKDIACEAEIASAEVTPVAETVPEYVPGETTVKPEENTETAESVESVESESDGE